MRLIFVISLMSLLASCGISPKDYSDAEQLKPIKSRIVVTPLWIKSTGHVPEYAHAQLPPAVIGKSVYISSVGGDVSLINADNGKRLWKHSVGDSITSGPGVGHGLVIVGTRSAEIIALDKKNAMERWRAKLTSEMLASPLVIPLDRGASIIVQTIDGKVAALDAESGKLIWSYNHDIPKLTLRGTATPIIYDGEIIAGFADGKLVSLNAKNGELNWKATITVPSGRTDLERLADIDGLFQTSDGTIYVSGYQGRIAAISAVDGNILWARKMSSYKGLSVHDGQIYITDIEGQVWSLDTRTGATLWRQNNLKGRDISAPVIIDKTVVLADYAGFVHWLSIEDGQFIARHSLNEIWNDTYHPIYDSLSEEIESNEAHRLVTVPPLAINNVLYIRDNTGAFAAFRVEPNSIEPKVH